MQYTRADFICEPDNETIREVLVAVLSEIGFESFMDTDSRLEAYIPSSIFSLENLELALVDFPMEASIRYTHEAMEDKNWNELWEKNYFQPISIGNLLSIFSSFHQPVGEHRYRIMIDPKMSFGTGHHQTTGLMLEELLALNVDGRRVLDMGCGTAVLAILASMRGAREVTAIDIDEWAYRNAIENVRLNKVDNIQVKQGDASHLEGDAAYNIILANINKNILLEDIPKYAAVMNKNGMLVISGFFNEDVHALRTCAEASGFTFRHSSEKDGWASVTFCYQ